MTGKIRTWFEDCEDIREVDFRSLAGEEVIEVETYQHEIHFWTIEQRHLRLKSRPDRHLVVLTFDYQTGRMIYGEEGVRLTSEGIMGGTYVQEATSCCPGYNYIMCNGHRRTAIQFLGDDLDPSWDEATFEEGFGEPLPATGEAWIRP